MGEVARSVSIPTVAISGINRGNLSELAKSPIAGIAVEITCILDAEDGELETKLLRNDVIEKILKEEKSCHFQEG